MVKLSYALLSALLLFAAVVSARRGDHGRPGRGHGEVIGNTCNSTTPCGDDEACVTTPYGNKCVDMDKLPCMADEDCPASGNCYMVEAEVGMCGGCAADTDCTGGKFCYMREKWMHGKCVECMDHEDCDASSYCGKKSSCEPKLADGEECKYSNQCLSGSCEREGRGRRGRGWGSPRGTCSVSENAAAFDLTDRFG